MRKLVPLLILSLVGCDAEDGPGAPDAPALGEAPSARVRLLPEVPLRGESIAVIVEALDPEGGRTAVEEVTWFLDGVSIGTGTVLSSMPGTPGQRLEARVQVVDEESLTVEAVADGIVGNRTPEPGLQAPRALLDTPEALGDPAVEVRCAALDPDQDALPEVRLSWAAQDDEGAWHDVPGLDDEVVACSSAPHPALDGDLCDGPALRATCIATDDQGLEQTQHADIAVDLASVDEELRGVRLDYSDLTDAYHASGSSWGVTYSFDEFAWAVDGVVQPIDTNRVEADRFVGAERIRVIYTLRLGVPGASEVVARGTADLQP